MADGVRVEQATIDRIKAMAKKAGVNLQRLGEMPDPSHLEDALMYGMGGLVQQQAESRLHRPGGGLRVQHIVGDEFANIDPAAYEKALAQINGGGAAQQRPFVRTKTLQEYTDADLVMEMIRRGYAAMKLPGDGGPPEMLR